MHKPATRSDSPPPVTPDDVRRHYDRIQREAARTGQKLNVHTINSERVAAEINESERRIVPGWLPPPPPKQWRIDSDGGAMGSRFVEPNRRLVVILTCSLEDDGRAWLHLSVSHRTRIPTWGELGIAKEAFLGDREAYQVMPPRARYVNIHQHVLNVFALLDAAEVVLPDFTRGTGGI